MRATTDQKAAYKDRRQFSDLYSDLIQSIRKSMPDIKADYQRGQKTGDYGYWATPDFKPSEQWGNRFVFQQFRDQQEEIDIFDQTEFRQFMAENFWYFTFMKLSPADEERLKECLKWALKHSENSSEMVWLPDTRQGARRTKPVSWYYLVDGLYQYHTLPKDEVLNFPCDNVEESIYRNLIQSGAYKPSRRFGDMDENEFRQLAANHGASHLIPSDTKRTSSRKPQQTLPRSDQSPSPNSNLSDEAFRQSFFNAYQPGCLGGRVGRKYGDKLTLTKARELAIKEPGSATAKALNSLKLPIKETTDEKQFREKFFQQYQPGCYGGRVGRYVSKYGFFTQDKAKEFAREDNNSATAKALQNMGIEY